MRKAVKFIICCVLSANLFLICFNSVSASAFGQGLKATGQDLGYNVEENSSALWQKIGKILSVSIIFLGVVFLGLMIYAGFIWMMARGNEQEVEKAKNMIIYAAVGLIIVLSAYAAVNLFYNIWTKAKAL